MPQRPLSSSPHRGEAATQKAEFRQQVLRSSIDAGLFDDQQLVVGFVDADGVGATIDSLHAAFPSHFRHTFAAKANSMTRALELVRTHGMGCEVASNGELRQALRAGFAPEEIIYDEPAKTRSILEFAISEGINFNIDNFQEFDRVRDLLRARVPTSKIGFRINPQVGSGSIGAMSTATTTSKFGVALNDGDNRRRLIDCYVDTPWLSSVHTHIGSQGCSIALMVSGIRRVMDFVDDIRAAGGRVDVLDIGGGLPVNFSCDEVTPTFAEYASALEAEVPELFSGELTVKTEFGRSIFAKNGFIAARVEYTKESGGRRIAITHAGAQTATRTTFMPDLWEIRLSVHDADGIERRSKPVAQDVAGPCCFAGDIIAHKRELPLIEPGDYVLLQDTGAYYFSNPFYYNNLPPCAVYAAFGSPSNEIQFDQWRAQPTPDAMLPVVG